MLLFDDNESSLKLAKNPFFQQRSKHILLKHHSLRDRVQSGIIQLCKVDTGFNAPDMITKCVGFGVLKICKQLAGMVISG